MYEQSTYNFKLNCKVKEKQQYRQRKKKGKKQVPQKWGSTNRHEKSFIHTANFSMPFSQLNESRSFFLCKEKKKRQSYITKSTVPSLRITSHCLSSFLYRKYISSTAHFGSDPPFLPLFFFSYIFFFYKNFYYFYAILKKNSIVDDAPPPLQ